MIVALHSSHFAVNVSEGRVQDMRDGIVSRSIWAIGKLKKVKCNRDGRANVFFLKSLKTFMTIDERATGR